MRRALIASMALGVLPVAGAEFRALGPQAAVLYDAPSTRADRLYVATPQYPFEVLVKLDHWTKVRDVNGEVAWVETKALGERPALIVTVPIADVRAAPNAQAPLAFEAYKQVLLEPLEPAADGWIKVRHRDGQQGYIRVTHVFGT